MVLLHEPRRRFSENLDWGRQGSGKQARLGCVLCKGTLFWMVLKGSQREEFPRFHFICPVHLFGQTISSLSKVSLTWWFALVVWDLRIPASLLRVPGKPILNPPNRKFRSKDAESRDNSGTMPGKFGLQTATASLTEHWLTGNYYSADLDCAPLTPGKHYNLCVAVRQKQGGLLWVCVKIGTPALGGSPP